ncbi:MAG: V-type ATP synthase subunit E family protein [Thermotogae bacterium]|jgi:vacuolar-type H+-ATPase subunit E/Vma4|nr:V-type ATP synthase subunit E family protein [Thermotogota bacterium]
MNVDKKLDALKTYVKNRSNDDVRSLIEETNKKAKEINQNYAKKGEEAYSDIIENAKKQVDDINRVEKAQAISKTMKISIEGQKDIIDDAMAILKEKLFELPQKVSYPDFLRYLVVEALNTIDTKKVSVKCRKEDKEIISKIVSQIADSKRDISISNEEIQIAGGVVVVSEDGKEIVENTLESKLEEIKEAYLKDLFSKLKVR